MHYIPPVGFETKQAEIQALKEDIRIIREQVISLNADLAVKRHKLAALISPFKLGDRFRYHGKKRWYRDKTFEVVGHGPEGPVMCYVKADGTQSKRFIVMRNEQEFARLKKG